MSALAMILAAGMVLSDGPERVSGEMEQGLDLRGEWEGALSDNTGITKTTVRRTSLVLHLDRGLTSLSWEVEDEGQGKLRMRFNGARYLGIYHQEGDRLIICFGCPNGPRATSLRTEHYQHLFTLHRVRPSK